MKQAGCPVSHAFMKESVLKLHRMKLYTQRLKNVPPELLNVCLEAGGWNLQENIIVKSVQSPSSHLSTCPFPIFTLSTTIIFSLAASCVHFFHFLFPVILCLLTHRPDVIYRHSNMRPSAVYFSISLRPPDHRHCYRPPQILLDIYSSVVKKSKVSCWEASIDLLLHLDL